MDDSYKELLKMIVPIIAVVVSYLLGLAASKSNYKKAVKKEIYNNYYSEILKLCYGLPSQSLLNFFSFMAYYHDEKLSKIIIENFQYVPNSILENWKKYNLTLKKYNHETLEKDIQKKLALSKILDYHSHLIIKKSLKESEKLSEELKLPQLSTQLLFEMYSTEHYRNALPKQELIQKYFLQELL
ncbi:hypothetical protein [Staphylococcus warneri]|uniref:hypothetical protein n=1 Tax=Staphylococcus warneri TaxID=1292 RepID=UPI000D1D3A9F|nr:hypothetical protein [Staphylococcus warneri]PTI21362.1 hypothetical protein BU082_01345 [Staphylococcus warneri]PTI26687.1 hypothetical protein BU081_02425 [Staphylococcus warneri]RIM98214.1 hypothetical protein BU093_08300 [Staphylococcus warneri]